MFAQIALLAMIYFFRSLALWLAQSAQLLFA
jgi:hypothetical protein